MITSGNPLNEQCTSVLHYKEFHMHMLQNTHTHESNSTSKPRYGSLDVLAFDAYVVCRQYGFSERFQELFATVEAVIRRAFLNQKRHLAEVFANSPFLSARRNICNEKRSRR